jgi:glycine cleavage system H protein
VVTLGISDFGQCSLGDILCADLPRVGEAVAKGIAAGWLDSYRKPLDLLSPVTGEVVEVNESLLQQPTRINAYPYAHEGILKVRVESTHEYQEMMDFARYANLVRQLRHYDEWSKERRVT